MYLTICLRRLLFSVFRHKVNTVKAADNLLSGIRFETGSRDLMMGDTLIFFCFHEFTIPSNGDSLKQVRT